jgi:hypothetical protein
MKLLSIFKNSKLPIENAPIIRNKITAAARKIKIIAMNFLNILKKTRIIFSTVCMKSCRPLFFFLFPEPTSCDHSPYQ